MKTADLFRALAEQIMRILHLITMLERGGAQFNTILSTEELLRRGHFAWMAASPGNLSTEADRLLGPCNIELGKKIAGFMVPGVLGDTNRRAEFTPALMTREISPAHDLRAIFGLRRLIRMLEPDIVHTHSSKAGIIGRLAARECRVPGIVHTVHGWGFHDEQSSVTRAMYINVERAAALVTDALVVVADANREKGLSEGIGKHDQYVTIRSGIEPPLREEYERRPKIRAKLGIPNDEFVVIWVGNFKPQKAPLDMAEVVVRLLDRHQKLHVLIVGNGTLWQKVEERMSAVLSGGGRAHLLGWRDDVPSLIAASDLLFHTARHEGLPRVILEARARGLPVVTSNVDGIPEAIGAGADAELFEPGDIEGIAGAILARADTASRRHPESESNAPGLPEEFTLKHMFGDLEKLYSKILAR